MSASTFFPGSLLHVAAAAAMLGGCQTAPDRLATSESVEPASPIEATALPTPPPPVPGPPVPGANVGSGRTIAPPRVADTADVSAEQLVAMFDAAVAQAGPSDDMAAICVGMQGLADRHTLDAPPAVVERLSASLRRPAVPASQCGFDVQPFVIATGARAMLYTVRVEARDARGVLTFWAIATYGNLGSNAMEFRLVREGGRWVPKFTGRGAVS